MAYIIWKKVKNKIFCAPIHKYIKDIHSRYPTQLLKTKYNSLVERFHFVICSNLAIACNELVVESLSFDAACCLIMMALNKVRRYICFLLEHAEDESISHILLISLSCLLLLLLHHIHSQGKKLLPSGVRFLKIVARQALKN